MSEILEGIKYTKDHEWVLLENDKVRIGVTDYAQKELGDIVFLELPEKGEKTKAGEPIGSIEAVKTVAELFAPVDGEIVETNSKVIDDSSLVNTDCYKDGWLAVIAPKDISQLDSLMDAAAYKKLIAE